MLCGGIKLTVAKCSLGVPQSVCIYKEPKLWIIMFPVYW